MQLRLDGAGLVAVGVFAGAAFWLVRRLRRGKADATLVRWLAVVLFVVAALMIWSFTR